MATVLVSETDSRGAKAVALAGDAGQWLKCRTRDGRKAYGILSSKGDGHYYLVTRTSCTCYDGQRRTCKHVQLHCELMAEQEQAAAAKKYDDTFACFEQDEDRALARILGGPAPWTRQRRGVIPASQIERED